MSVQILNLRGQRQASDCEKSHARKGGAAKVAFEQKLINVLARFSVLSIPRVGRVPVRSVLLASKVIRLEPVSNPGGMKPEIPGFCLMLMLSHLQYCQAVGMEPCS